MKKRLLTLLVVTLTCVVAISAQGRRGLRINEVMIENDSSSVVDDFGKYSAWVELFNSTFVPLGFQASSSPTTAITIPFIPSP